MLMRFLFGVFATALLSGCANVTTSTGVEPPRTIKVASGQYICAVHHVPLVTIKGYKDPSIICSTPLLESDRKREAQNPNAIYIAFSSVRTNECTEAAEITYCPSCQAAMEGQSVYYGDERNF